MAGRPIVGSGRYRSQTGVVGAALVTVSLTQLGGGVDKLRGPVGVKIAGLSRGLLLGRAEPGTLVTATNSEQDLIFARFMQ